MNTTEEGIQRIIESCHSAPHTVLGPHYRVQDDLTIVRAFLPHAHTAYMTKNGVGTVRRPMQRIHPAGLFEGQLSGMTEPLGYRLVVTDTAGTTQTLYDPYSIKLSHIAEEDITRFAAGQHHRAFEMLGAHPRMERGVAGTHFAVWAPNAQRVSVVGNFNRWDGRVNPMRRLKSSGIWELFIPDIAEGTLYKFELKTEAGAVFLKTDPYAFYGESRPHLAAIVCRPPTFEEHSGAHHTDPQQPPYVFELEMQVPHKHAKEPDSPSTYQALMEADWLREIKMKGFTHVLIPLSASPQERRTFYYGPEECYGSPTALRALIDSCHRKGLGVVVPGIPDSVADDLDWAWFDGTRLYEREAAERGRQAVFDEERSEVRSFLISNVNFWRTYYQVDGFVIDALGCKRTLAQLQQLDRGTTVILAKSTVSSEPVAADIIERLLKGRLADPFAVLGPHYVESEQLLVIRALLPRAHQVYTAIQQRPGVFYQMTKIHPPGLFEVAIPSATRGLAYRLISIEPGGHRVTIDDPYAIAPTRFTACDRDLLLSGNHYQIFCKLGAHPQVLEGIPGVTFALWAPNADGISVVGNFNHWDGRGHPMKLHRDSGVWEIFIPNLHEGEIYKYEIRTPGEGFLLKADPYAFFSETPPKTASIVYDPASKYTWHDEAWMQRRREIKPWERPVSVYEVHVASWMQAVGHQHISYKALGEQLVTYVKRMGFTHIELLPIAEHPYGPSWGYQITSFYAPSSRYGKPEELMAFVDLCHQNEIGVILDWVPAHFPKDAYALGRFDGTALYEHADPRQGEHRDWGTLVFNYGRYEVSNFLLANALFWLETYHFDGLRVDAVASMLYLDYSRKSGEWIPNVYGGNENLEAIDFLRHTNIVVHQKFPGAMMIAEESTAWPGVSRPTDQGGLGFGFKWNMGWMHDVLSYMKHDPFVRQHYHQKLTFSFHYAFHENFVLPLSHDEVVHMKGSLFNKMPGNEWEKFANLRLLYTFMYAHPGKKLLFMGGEFGQRNEWNHDAQLSWELLEREPHRRLSCFMRDLNRLYHTQKALFEADVKSVGFEAITLDHSELSVIAFIRKAKDPRDCLFFVMNFAGIPRQNFRVGVPFPTFYRELLNSDATEYGGHGQVLTAEGASAEETAWHGYEFSLSLTVPALGALILKPMPAEMKEDC
jgi:1,4-alpha-glucan branching enzyme